jgi:hypothetical protein
MRWWGRYLPLVLLTLVVLLGAESPKPRDTVKPSESGKLVEHPSQYNHSNARINGTETKNRGSGSQNQTAALKNPADKNDTGSGMMIFLTIVMAGATVIMAIATVFLAIFNSRLVGVTKDMHEATKDAAVAAERALHLDRPFLLAGSFELKNFHAESRRVAATFGFRNWGKGPAFVIEIRARLSIANDLDLPYGVGESRPKSNFPDDISYDGDDTYLQVANEILEGGRVPVSTMFP